MATVLLIEDETALGMIVKDSLIFRGFEVLYADNGVEGLEQFRRHQPDIVVADIMMPDMDGFTMAEHIRREDPHIPIMFLTARSQTADVVRGFELGGNDYLKKPFSLDELIVRINALLRAGASSANTNGTLKIGRYLFDPAKQKLAVDDREVTLSHREAELLRRLYQQRNQVLGRSEILTELWGDDSFFNGRSLDVFITKLRRYLRDDSKVQIINIRGEGISWCFKNAAILYFCKKDVTMKEEIQFKIGERKSDPRSMSREDRVRWQDQLASKARDYLFSIGQPMVYKRDGHVVAEYHDGRIQVIR